MGWVTAGLKDFSLSRAKVEWGIRVPWDPSQTFYVWTDALMGYLTGAATNPSTEDPNGNTPCQCQEKYTARPDREVIFII